MVTGGGPLRAIDVVRRAVSFARCETIQRICRLQNLFHAADEVVGAERLSKEMAVGRGKPVKPNYLRAHMSADDRAGLQEADKFGSELIQSGRTRRVERRKTARQCAERTVVGTFRRSDFE